MRPNRRRVVAGVSAALISTCGLEGCSRTETLSGNVKLNFLLNIRGVKVQRSGIWRFSLRDVSSFPNPGSSIHYTLRGDAIDFGVIEGVSVFAILAYSESLVQPVSSNELFAWNCVPLLASGYGVSAAWEGGDAPGLRQLITNSPTPLVEIQLYQAPSLVAFSNPLRPETGRLISPSSLTGGEPSTARVEKVEIQLVDEPPSRGSVSKLTWLRPRPFRPELLEWNDFRNHPEYFSR